MTTASIYQPSPFLAQYGVGASTAPPNVGNNGFGSGILNQNSNFLNNLSNMQVGQSQLPSGSWLSNQMTKLNMSESFNDLKNTGSRVNNFVQQQGGGWGNVLGGLSSLMQLYTGWKSLGLEQDKFDFSRDAWNKNFNAQVQDYENNLRDRWAARNEVERLAGRSGFMSEDAYIAQRGIGG